MATESILSRLGIDDPLEPQDRPDAQTVPRVVFLALDTFGERVSHAVQTEWQKEVPEFKGRLTVFRRYVPGRGFEPLPAGLSPLSGTSRPDLENSDSLESDPLDPAGLARQLAEARQAVCSQPKQAELLRQGYRISPRLELYVVAEVKRLLDLHLFQKLLSEVILYFRRFEPLFVISVISLAEYEAPDSTSDDRDALLEALDRMLSEGGSSSGGGASKLGIDRCYIVTPETVGGRSVIPRNELEERTAGFLAVHHLDSLRQSGTTYRHRLFGQQEVDSPKLEKGTGLCDLFGYADMRFDLEHVLSWCAYEQARRVLSQVFLSAGDLAGEDKDRLDPLLERQAEQISSALSIEKLRKEILDGVLQQVGSVEGSLCPERGSLDSWREIRKTLDQSMRRAEELVREKVQETQQQLEQTFSGAVDGQISASPGGLVAAERLLRRIEGTCLDQWKFLARLSPDANKGADNTYSTLANEGWIQLSRAATAMPAPTVFLGRLGLLALLVVVGILLGGWEGVGIVAGAVVAMVMWSVYAYLWLPARLRRAEERYRDALGVLRRLHLEPFILDQLREMMPRLLERFCRGQDRTLDVEKVDNEWENLQRWRGSLVQAVKVCEDRAKQQRSASSSSGTGAYHLGISDDELLKYHARLTAVASLDAAQSFLDQRRAGRADWWRTCPANMLATDLHQTYHELYRKDAPPEMESLEHHLLEIGSSKESRLEILMDALIQMALPMARFNRLWGYWEPAQQTVLIVHDAEHSAFRRLANNRSVQIISGARPHRMTCIQTMHHIPVYDLALAAAGRGQQMPWIGEVADD
jgi:hypothetical protein